MTVNIWQAENAYILDFAAGGDELNSVNCKELLQELGCIEYPTESSKSSDRDKDTLLEFLADSNVIF